MKITRAYRDRFAAALADAKLGTVSPLLTPENFPHEDFDYVGFGLRMVRAPGFCFENGPSTTASAIDEWFASLWMQEPATLADGLYFCANHNLNFSFLEWDEVVAWGSRSKARSLMPSFRSRNENGQHGGCCELKMAYRPKLPVSEQDRFLMSVGYLVRQKRPL
ncbi:MAG: hypothetical protein WCK01_04080 [Candidatus Uhrbacteria bacterium]